MQNYLYAISDIHGMADLFKNSTDYDPKLHQLLLIGDLNDRGRSQKSAFFWEKLVEEYQAIYLRGNHEYFLQFLNALRIGLPLMYAMAAKKRLKVFCIQALLRSIRRRKLP